MPVISELHPPIVPAVCCLAVWLLLSLAFCAFAQELDTPQPLGWLNARDLGASGSRYQTVASTTAGSRQITVADPGDFKVGQGVMVSKCFVRYTDARLWGPRDKYGHGQPLGDALQMRGYDGSSGSWTVFIIDTDGTNPSTYRWSDDLGRTWKETKVPLTDQWHALSGGTEVRFGKLDWDAGYTVTFSARDQLVSVIEEIEGNVLTLQDPANRTVQDAVVRHNDQVALQRALDAALKQKRNLFIPRGYYRLATGLTINNASGIVVQGGSAPDTIFDIGEGVGSCFRVVGGTEVALRNLTMVGHTGFDGRDQAGHLRTKGAQGVWGFYLKPCSALNIRNTERVLVENCHASRMSAECFYSQGRSRQGTQEPKAYTKSITYLRCSVEDSARNAFNNNDMAENTSVLHCRIRNVGGCSWEGASRFVRFIGNYVRNSGTVAMGNIRSRDARFEQLASGQHIIADNVFEEGVCYGGCAIRAAAGANQVIIRNNIFVNYGTSAIEIRGTGSNRDMPARTAAIIGNIMDLTSLAETPAARIAVDVSADDVIIADNQIYSRGEPDPTLTAFTFREPAMNLQAHDNLVRNCGYGIVTTRAQSTVSEVIDPRTFCSYRGRVPNLWRQSHRYRGWQVVWLRGTKPVGVSTIEAYDPDTLQFKLTDPREMKVGDVFELRAPAALNWQIHDNIVTGCLSPIVLDSYGSTACLFRDNLISRGGAAAVKQAVQVRGSFQFIGNHFTGFDEQGSAVLGLYLNRSGKPPLSIYRNNTFENCASVVSESQEGLWAAAATGGNTYLGCKSVPQ